MQSSTKIATSFALALAAILFIGCVRSLHPLYESSDVVFRQDLLGTWQQSGEEATWQFTPSTDDDRDRSYRLVVTDDKGRPGTFSAHLVKLENRLYLDLFPMAPQVANNGLHRFHFQRVHTFLRVTFDDESLTLAPMNPNWLENYLQQNPDGLSHTLVTPSGHRPTGDEGTAAERLLLTASTPELQAFLQQHADDPDSFGDPMELIRL